VRKLLDPPTGTTVVSVTGGRWLSFPHVPSNVGRVVCSSAMIATTSMMLVEIPRLAP
jgi:hypothetical protein